MGRLRDELTDPWGLLVAGVAGGVAWAAAGPIAVGVGVGAAVYGVKVLAGALYGPSDEERNARRNPERPPRPAYGTPAAIWLKRAEEAVRSLDGMVRQPAETATDVATAHAAEEADAVLDTMRRLGGQSVMVSRALVTAEADGQIGRAYV